MKKILSFILVLVMIMAMAIPAFAATNDEVAPCALCNGNHTYEVVEVTKSHSYSRNGCVTTTTTYYKCAYCTDHYETVNNTTSSHDYKLYSATCNGTTQTHNYKCSACKHILSEYEACPRPGHTVGNCSWLPI